MAEPFVLSEVTDRVGWITLNEPARLNPVNYQRVCELNAACAAMSARDDVSVVVVTGAGRGFCSGGDTKGDYRDDPVHPASGSLLDDGTGMWTLTGMRQPVIAMVNGPAIGYGAELAVQADLRIAGESAFLSFPFSLMNLVSDTCAGSWLLPRIIGTARAADLLYSGRRIGAAEALQIGLVQSVVPDAQLRDHVAAYAQELAKASTWSLFEMKKLIFGGLDEPKAAHLMRQYFTMRRRDRTAGIKTD